MLSATTEFGAVLITESATASCEYSYAYVLGLTAIIDNS